MRAFRKLLAAGHTPAGDRAQPRCDPRGRLAGRPGAGGRRRRRRGGRHGHAARPDGQPALAHRPRPARLRGRHPAGRGRGHRGSRRPGAGRAPRRIQRRHPAAIADAPPAQSAARARKPSRSSTRASTTSKNVSVEIPRDKFTVITGAVGLGQVHPGLRHSVQRRPAALPGIAQRLRARHRAAGRQARRGRHLRHPAHRGHRTAHQPRRAQVHRGDDDRDPPLPAAAVRRAGHAVFARLPACRSSRRRRDQIVARLLREPRRPARRRRWPRWSSARKGCYTDLAKVGLGGKAIPHLRVDGVFTPSQPLAARLDRYREHTIGTAPWPTCRSAPANEAAPARRRQARAGVRPGACMGVVWPLDKSARATPARRWSSSISPPSAPAPSAASSFPELDPRMFSYNSKHGWCPACYRQRASLSQGFDEEQTGEESVLDRRRRRGAGLPQLPRAAPEPRRPGRAAGASRSIARARRAWRSARRMHLLRSGWCCAAAKPRSPATSCRKSAAGLNFMKRSAWTTWRWTAPRPRCRAAKRSASAWPRSWAPTCRACATCWTNPRSACIRATTASCSMRWASWKAMATRWWWSSMTTTPSAARPHHRYRPRRGRARRPRGGAGHRRRTSWRRPSRRHRTLSGPALRHPLQGRRAVDRRHGLYRASSAAHLHNLRNVNARLPVGRLTVVTGVSGSGKSTLAREVLLDNLLHAVSQGKAPAWKRLHRHHRLGSAGPRAGSGPDPHRQNAAFLPRPRISASGTRCASCSPTRAKPACAAGRRRASPSTPATAAARCAKARACGPSR